LSERYDREYKAQRDKLAELYLSGLPYRQISEQMGWGGKCAVQHVGAELHRLRNRYGYDLPYRYSKDRRTSSREARWAA
jgi:hypothetical protein